MMPGVDYVIVAPMDGETLGSIASGNATLKVLLVIHYKGILSETDKYTYELSSDVSGHKIHMFENLGG